MGRKMDLSVLPAPASQPSALLSPLRTTVRQNDKVMESNMADIRNVYGVSVMDQVFYMTF
jgi:hypothetical protein